MGLGGVLWSVVWSWVVLGGLGEVLGGFLWPDRFPACTTVEGQVEPRGVRGARAPKRPPKVDSRRDLILSSFFDVFVKIFLLCF